jgi:predicted nucleic acid-binding protein
MRLFLDASALIYRFEGAPAFRAAVVAQIAQLTAGQNALELAVSRLSVLECRAKPLRDGDLGLLKQYDDFFAAVTVVELSPAVVELATQLCVRDRVTTSCALQAACALSVPSGTIVVTGDAAFTRVQGLDVILIALAS